MIPLKACPFCGGGNLRLRESPFSAYAYVACETTKCNAQGPTGKDGKEASEKWNRAPRKAPRKSEVRFCK